MDRISIIVPTYNRKVMLQRLLESFGKLRCHFPLEFIIVDDCSDDGTRAIVEAWKSTIGFADVKYHSLSSRSGPARARNAGISLSTGNIIAFTDDDCVVDPAWLDHLYELLISCPDYAGVGGRVLPVGDDIYSRYSTIYRVLDPHVHLSAVVTANCMFWKQLIVDAGQFDECFVVTGGEETALCMKLGLNGYHFGYEEKAVVYHEYRQSLRDFYTAFYRYGNGDKVMYHHSLNEYLRYIHYPEKSHNTLAFRNHPLFLLLFFWDLVFGIACQYRALRRVSSSYKERLMLNSLYAIHLFSYHLGRGTFSGTLPETVNKYLADHPDCLITIDPDTENLSPVLEITDVMIPSVLKPGEKVKSSITIKNPSRDHYISAGFLIILNNKEDHTVFYQTPKLQDMIFFPMTDMAYHFSLKSPLKEQKNVLQLSLVTKHGQLLNDKREKVITISSELPNPDAKTQ